MAAKATAAPSSSPAQLTSSATTFGDIYGAIERLKESSSDFFAAYESDVSAYALAERAGNIRHNAAQLEDVLIQISAALQNLEV